MKKNDYSLFALTVILTVLCSSCNKSALQNQKPEEDAIISVKGIISQDVTTKTDYDIDWDEQTATFSWKGEESFSRLYTISTGVEKKVYSGTASQVGDTELNFTGESVTDDSGYAFYPSVNSAYLLGWSTSTGKMRIELKASSAYESSNPIKGYMPMIGKLIPSSNLYEFSPVTGVLAVRITHIPAGTTSITMSSPNTSGGFSGYFDTGETKANYKNGIQKTYEDGIQFSDCESNGSSRSFTFSNLNNTDEYYFYFPTPVGNLNGLQIDLGDQNGTFYSISSSKVIKSEKGIITRLPLITIADPGAAISGNKNTPTATFTYNGASIIKYCLSTSSSDHLSNPTETTETSIPLAPGKTGTYYLIYQGFKEDGTTPVGEERNVRFLYVSNNVSDIAGKYQINNKTEWGFDISAVDPAVDGKNVMISKYYSTANAYNEASGTCYGVFNASDGTITIPSAQILTKDDSQYYLIGFSGNVSTTSSFGYKDNFELTITEVDDDAGIKFYCDKICVAPKANVNTGDKTFKSGGQHFTSDGSGGSTFLYKANN